MNKVQKAKEFVKEHKKEILIGFGSAALAVGGARIIGKLPNKYPYKLLIESDNKDYIDGLKGYVDWGSKVKMDSAAIGYGRTANEIQERVTEFLGENADEYLYCMVIEKMKKPE